MKKLIYLLIPVLMLLFYITPLWNLRLPDGEYPDLILPEGIEKTAIVVVAHEDDASAMNGLIYKMIQAGWQIDFLTFYQNEDGYRSEEIPIRRQELEQYAKSIGLHATHTPTFQMRKQGSDSIHAQYMPLHLNEMHLYFEIDSLRRILKEKIHTLQPAVLLSFDDQFGGYGHPEHLLVSKTLGEICKNAGPDLSVKYFYQIVLSDIQEARIAHLPVVLKARDVYGTSGTPDPDVALPVHDITGQMKFGLTVWKSQQRNIRKFFPYFQFYPHWLYFRVIDKEYYRILQY